MPTDPLTASRYPASTAAPNVPQDIQNAVSDLSVNTTPRFASTAARDAAYTAYTNAGGTLANGRSCWTDDSGYWDRIGGVWVARATKTDVFGTSGTLSLIGGWAAFSGYHTPSWTLSSAGVVTLHGAVLRTAASFALGTGPAFQFATLPGALVPTATVSPTGVVGVGSVLQAFPCRIVTAGSSTSLTVVGMDSGTGTVTQNVGFVIIDGATWRI